MFVVDFDDDDDDDVIWSSMRNHPNKRHYRELQQIINEAINKLGVWSAENNLVINTKLEKNNFVLFLISAA